MQPVYESLKRRSDHCRKYFHHSLHSLFYVKSLQNLTTLFVKKIPDEKTHFYLKTNL